MQLMCMGRALYAHVYCLGKSDDLFFSKMEPLSNSWICHCIPKAIEIGEMVFSFEIHFQESIPLTNLSLENIMSVFVYIIFML